MKWLQNSMKQQQKTLDKMGKEMDSIMDENEKKVAEIKVINEVQKQFELHKADKTQVDKVEVEVSTIRVFNTIIVLVEHAISPSYNETSYT